MSVLGVKMIIKEFTRLNEQECTLCGLPGQLTGEHKIKASLLRAEFGKRHAIISGKDLPKILQSHRSKHAHFKRKICKHCNSAQTQAADKAFDKLHAQLKQLHTNGFALTDQNNVPNVKLSPEEELDLFRYFAKILCCFLVEVGGPRSRSVSAFALSKSDKNPIFLKITQDAEYEAKLAANNTQGFAEHGGLIFRFDDKKRWVESIDSSISAGGIQYVFWVQLSKVLSRELHLEHSDIVRKARANIVESA